MTIRSVVEHWPVQLVLALILSWSILASAEPGHGGGVGRERDRGGEGPEPRDEERDRDEDHSERMLEMLDKTLELKGEQKAKVKSIMEEGKPRMEAIKKEMKALQEKIKKEMFAQTEKIRGVLADEQKMKFDEMKMRMMDRMQGGGMRGVRPRMRGGESPGRRFGPPDGDDDGPGERMRDRMGEGPNGRRPPDGGGE